MRILFMGTPQIATASLTALIKAGHSICGVFTREDKPVGRKQQLTPPPVKVLALQHGIPVYQPKNFKGDAANIIRKLAPQLIAVVAYGRILPPEVLAIPKYGAINLHVSLLPQYRGAAPIQWALIRGESKTGVSVMYMNEGLDTGDLLRVLPVPIDPNETAGELFERLEPIGAAELVAAVASIENGIPTRTVQNESEATFAPPLTKEMGAFSFSRSAQEIHNLVRGLNPWPIAYFECGGKKIKVLKTKYRNENAAVGTVLSIRPLVVACMQGSLELCELVPEGSRPMEGTEWAAGRRFKVGDCIESKIF